MFSPQFNLAAILGLMLASAPAALAQTAAPGYAIQAAVSAQAGIPIPARTPG